MSFIFVFKTSSSRRTYSLYSYIFRRRLKDVLKTSSRRLEDVLKKLLQDVLKKSWRRFEDALRTQETRTLSRRFQDVSSIYTVLVNKFFKMSSRRLQDVLIKTNIFVLVIRLQDALPRRLQNVFKTSWRRLAKTSSRRFEDVFNTSSTRKTYWRCLEDVFARHLEDVLKTFWRCLEDARNPNAFKTLSRRIIKLYCSC